MFLDLFFFKKTQRWRKAFTLLLVLHCSTDVGQTIFSRKRAECVVHLVSGFKMNTLLSPLDMRDLIVYISLTRQSPRSGDSKKPLTNTNKN